MSLGRNTAYNLAGFLIPALMGVIAVPIYLQLIGTERFGVMALAWLVLGYFGLFDLGLSRATAQRIAVQRDAAGEEHSATIATSLVANIGLGFAGAILLYPAGWYLFAHVFHLSPAMREEALNALPLLVLALPVATTTGVLSGALQGRGEFFESNRISITSTAIFQFLPLSIAWIVGPQLPWVMGAAIVSRLVGGAMLWRSCRRVFGPMDLRHWDRSQLAPLLSFGGWVTVTGMLGPLLVFSDRFVIGSIMGATAVTIYSVPLDATRRLAGFAQALGNALFPRLAVAGEDEARQLSREAVGTLYAALTPPVVFALFLMDPVMRLWLGQEIGSQAAPLARCLLIAAWINTLGHIPYVRLIARGRPNLVALNVLAQVPVYLLALWVCLPKWGLMAAAWVYIARMLVDAVALFVIANRRIDYPVLLGLTTVALCVAAILLNAAGQTSIMMLIGWATIAVGVSLIPAFSVAPQQVIGHANKLLRRVGPAPADSA